MYSLNSLNSTCHTKIVLSTSLYQWKRAKKSLTQSFGNLGVQVCRKASTRQGPGVTQWLGSQRDIQCWVPRAKTVPGSLDLPDGGCWSAAAHAGGSCPVLGSDVRPANARPRATGHLASSFAALVSVTSFFLGRLGGSPLVLHLNDQWLGW